MLSRAAVICVPASSQQVRGMATLRDIKNRLNAVKNIQKITKSMKIVSAAKYAKAEKDLKPARPYGAGALAFFQKAEVKQDEKKPNHLIIALSSDRGLCGGVHSSIFKAIRAHVPTKPAGTVTKFIPVGDKPRNMLARLFKHDILFHFADVGKKVATMGDAGFIANNIIDSGFEYDHGEMFYNVFKTVVSYQTSIMPVYTNQAVNEAQKLPFYDSLDEDVLLCYNEFALYSKIFYAMREGACSEQSARMTAMDAATKNAGEMIDKLTLLYNRKRQSVITTELIEIISGAAALE